MVELDCDFAEQCAAAGHCALCHRPQRTYNAYIVCVECGHAYRTRLHLFVAYWQTNLRMWRRDRNPRTAHPPMTGMSRERFWPLLWHLVRKRPRAIYFCQCCSHDF